MTVLSDNMFFPFLSGKGKNMLSLYLPTDMSIQDARRLKRMVNVIYINGKNVDKPES